MIVFDRESPIQSSSALNARISSDVHYALNSIITVSGRFVVNDSLWYIRRGNGKITPAVMNKADYISKKFQNALRDNCNWEKEKTIAGQTIDNYLEVDAYETKYRITPDKAFLDYFVWHCEQTPPLDLRKEFLATWHQFVKLGVSDVSSMDSPIRYLFEKVNSHDTIRIGLEFETGNIASAFRALDKLESLFVAGLIDFGVFVTCNDRENAATRIWPQSNRNGSFTELENRNYRNNRTIPLWEFGFQPDEFSKTSQYFSASNLYMPFATGRIVEEQGMQYEVFVREIEEILRPVNSQHSHRFDAL